MSETTNTVKLAFLTEAGSSFSVSLKYALDSLADAGEDAVALVKSVYEYILTYQPFEAVLTAFTGATFTASTETDILTDTVYASDIASDESE